MKNLLKVFLVVLTLILTVSIMTSCDVEGLKENIGGLTDDIGNLKDNIEGWKDNIENWKDNIEDWKDFVEDSIPGASDECEHSWLEATCISPMTCEFCDTTKGNALGHTKKTVYGYAADCYNDGLTDGEICDVCNEVFVPQEIITSPGHTPGAAATCTADQVCTVCNETLVEKHHVPGAEATCTTDQRCTKCMVILVKKHHVPGPEANCTDDQTCTRCGDVLVEKYHVPGAEATCTTDQICTVCGDVLVAMHHVPGPKATCTTATDQTCTVCGDVLEKWAHKPGTEASCTKNQTCTVCKIELAPMHPNRTTLYGYDPTCTEDGLTEGEKCSNCPAVFVKQEVIPATGHNFEDGYCTACGQEYYNVGMVFGLRYNSEEDHYYYFIESIGNVSDKDIVIPSKYKGIPVEVISGYFTKDSKYKENFETITIPSSIKKIEMGSYNYSNEKYGAFAGCVNLKKVYIESLDSWFNIVIYRDYNRTASNPLHYGAELYAGGELVTEVTVPSRITQLERDYFDGCTSITKINFHNSLYVLCGFFNLPNLTEVTIPSSVKVVGDAFDGCTNLSVINIPDTTYHIFTKFRDTAYYNNPANWDEGKVLYVGRHLLEAKDDISGEYTVRPDTLSIASSAFMACINITKLTLNDGLLVIGDTAFYNTLSLKGITIPYSVRYIGHTAFEGMNNGHTYDLELVFEYKGAWKTHGYLYENLNNPNYIYGTMGYSYIVFYVNNKAVTGIPSNSSYIHDNCYGCYTYTICR